ncbi:hypothetical protein DES40_1668 [Litorimonas taeanensis]|uniref:Uncharacterized protein n=1 Tax=Litorimonas taeanensis TaxID=568099 RepID=A0A420WD36_9PROT|nr:hypothetical protein DES40_1668 [Litorimonas taeanensis]
MRQIGKLSQHRIQRCLREAAQDYGIIDVFFIKDVSEDISLSGVLSFPL